MRDLEQLDTYHQLKRRWEKLHPLEAERESHYVHRLTQYVNTPEYIKNLYARQKDKYEDSLLRNKGYLYISLNENRVVLGATTDLALAKHKPLYTYKSGDITRDLRKARQAMQRYYIRDNQYWISASNVDRILNRIVRSRW